MSEDDSELSLSPEEICREAETCYRAFHHFNRERMKIMRQLTPSHRRNLITMIPFLLHINSPKAPGYEQVLGDCCGLHGYRPDDQVKILRKEYFPKLTQIGAQTGKSLIVSLATIGSAGTLAQTETSDFDFWITCDNSISKDQYKAIERKAAAVHEWLLALDPEIDVTFYMGTPDRVKQHKFGDVSDDSAGDALGRLLKEEFYRTCIVWSGQMPLWWSLPISVNSKADYEAWQRALIEGEFQYKDGVMDMGPLERADQETFLGAVLWQTNKSLKNPFKSLLKLVLVDKYANQPNCELLAERVRAYVHENPNDDERTDPYLCLFEAAAGYLQEKRDFDGVRLACESYFSKTISEVDSGSKARMTISDVEARIQKRRRAVRDQMRGWGLDQADMMELLKQDEWDFDKSYTYRDRIQGFVKDIFDHAVLRLGELGFRYHHGELLVSRENAEPGLVDMLKQFTNIGHKVDCFYGKATIKIDPIPPGFQDLLSSQTYNLVFNEELPRSSRWSLSHEIYLRDSARRRTTSIVNAEDETEETQVAMSPIVGDETIYDDNLPTDDDETTDTDRPTSSFDLNPLSFADDGKTTTKLPQRDSLDPDMATMKVESAPRMRSSSGLVNANDTGTTGPRGKDLISAASPCYLLGWLAANRLATATSELRCSINGVRKPAAELKRLVGKFATFFRHPLYKDKLPDSTFRKPPAPYKTFISFDLLAHSQFKLHERASSRVFGITENAGAENTPTINHLTVLEQDTYGVVNVFDIPTMRYTPTQLMARLIKNYIQLESEEFERRLLFHGSDTTFHRNYIKDYCEALIRVHAEFRKLERVDGLAFRVVTLVSGRYFSITRMPDDSWRAEELAGMRELLSYLERPLGMPVRTIIDPAVSGPERVRVILSRWLPGRIQIFVHRSANEPNSANIHVLDEAGCFYNERMDAREVDAQMGGLSFFVARLANAPLKFVQRKDGKLQYHVWRVVEIPSRSGQTYDYAIEPQPKEPSRNTTQVLTELVYVKLHGSLDLREPHIAELIARGEPRRMKLNGATLVQDLANEIDKMMQEYKCSNFCIIELGRSKTAVVRAQQSIEYLGMRRAVDRTLRRIILEKQKARKKDSSTQRRRQDTSNVIKAQRPPGDGPSPKRDTDTTNLRSPDPTRRPTTDSNIIRSAPTRRPESQ